MRALSLAAAASSARLSPHSFAAALSRLPPLALLCPSPARCSRSYSLVACSRNPPRSSLHCRPRCWLFSPYTSSSPSYPSCPFSQRAADGSVALPAEDVNEAFEVLYPSTPSSSTFPVLLTCEHASAVMPEGYGLPAADGHLQGSHWQVDLGAAELTRELSAALQCPALLSRCSRLVVDVNRPLQSETLMRPMADGVEVQLNRALTPHQFEDRITRFYLPYHRRLRQLVAQHQPTLALSIHSFSPTYEGHRRSVEVGVLYRRALDQPHAHNLLSSFRAAGCVCELNAPWSGLEGFMYAMDSLTSSHPTSSPILAPAFTTAAITTHSGAVSALPPTATATAPAAAAAEVDADAAAAAQQRPDGSPVSPSLTLMLECRQDLLADAAWRKRCVDVISSFARALTTPAQQGT